jgi:hypothetical protein
LPNVTIKIFPHANHQLERFGELRGDGGPRVLGLVEEVQATP